MSEKSTNEINWPLLIEEWQSSGLPQNEFGKIKQIKYNSFIYQKGRILKPANSPVKFSKVVLDSGALSSAFTREITIEVANYIKVTAPAEKSVVQMVLDALREER